MKPTVSINILVDTSRFMQQHVADAAQELNRLIASYQNCDVTVSYSVFSDEYQSVFIDKPIKEVKTIAIKPEGQSALFESACKMIDEVGKRLATKPENERPEKVVFILLTAGQDSVSDLTYSKQLLQEKVQHQSNVYSWEFVFPVVETSLFYSSVVRIREPIKRTKYQFVADLIIPQNETAAFVFDRVIDFIYDWISIKLGTSTPSRERFTENFEFDQFILPSLKIATIPDEGRWCCRLIHADEATYKRPAIAGLTWTSDIALHNDGVAVHFAMQVFTTAVSHPDNEKSIRPRLISDMARQIGFVEALPIQTKKWYDISCEMDIEQIAGAVLNRSRQIPIVLIAMDVDKELPSLVFQRQLTVERQSILSFAHIVVLPEIFKEAWKQRVGETFAVTDGGVRIYYPYSEQDVDTAVAHPSYTADEINSWLWAYQYGNVAFATFLKDTLSDFATIKPMDWGSCLFYPQMRSRITELRLEQLAKSQYEKDYIVLLEDDNNSQRKQLEEYKWEIEHLKEERFKLKQQIDSQQRPQKNETPTSIPRVMIRRKAMDDLKQIKGNAQSALVRIINKCADKDWRQRHTDHWHKTNLTVIKPGATAERLAGFEHDCIFYVTNVFDSHEEYETKLPLYSIESTRNEEFAELDI